MVLALSQSELLGALPRATFVGPPQASISLSAGNKKVSFTRTELKDLLRQVKDALKLQAQTDWIHKPPTAKITQIQRAELALATVEKGPVDNLHDLEPRKERLKTLFTKYKADQDLYPGGDGTFSQQDLEQLEIVCRQYPALYDLLLEKDVPGKKLDPFIASFVKFCLRAGLSVDIFVKFPAEVDFIHSHYLTSRLSLSKELLTTDGTHLYLMVDGNPVAIEGEENKKKSVKLPNLVNPQAESYEVSLADIFKDFKEKRSGYGIFEIFPGRGVSNWDAIHLGSYNPVTQTLDVINPQKDPNWFSKLPRYESLSRPDLAKRYPGFEMVTDHAFVFSSNQQQTDLNVLETHGFVEIVVKDSQNPSRFLIYPIGYQPKTLPSTFWERLGMLKKTNPAGVHFPDEGRVLLNRMLAFFPVSLNTEEFQAATKAIGHTISKSLLGNAYFQLTNKNCAYAVMKWYFKSVGEKLYKPLRELWETHLSDVGKEKYKQLTKGIQRHLDENAEQEFVDTLVNRLVDKCEVNEIKKLADSCTGLLSLYLRQGEEALPLLEVGKITVALVNEQEKEELRTSLKGLLKAAIEIQQVYKTSLFETRTDLPLFSQILSTLSINISWKPLQRIWSTLRVWAMRFVFFCLGSCRSLKIKDKQGQEKSCSTAKGALCGRFKINLPAKFGTEWLTKIRPEKIAEARNLIGRIGQVRDALEP